jgi:hypothetical protein
MSCMWPSLSARIELIPMPHVAVHAVILATAVVGTTVRPLDEPSNDLKPLENVSVDEVASSSGP